MGFAELRKEYESLLLRAPGADDYLAFLQRAFQECVRSDDGMGVVFFGSLLAKFLASNWERDPAKAVLNVVSVQAHCPSPLILMLASLLSLAGTDDEAVTVLNGLLEEGREVVPEFEGAELVVRLQGAALLACLEGASGRAKDVLRELTTVLRRAESGFIIDEHWVEAMRKVGALDGNSEAELRSLGKRGLVLFGKAQSQRQSSSWATESSGEDGGESG